MAWKFAVVHVQVDGDSVFGFAADCAFFPAHASEDFHALADQIGLEGLAFGAEALVRLKARHGAKGGGSRWGTGGSRWVQLKTTAAQGFSF